MITDFNYGLWLKYKEFLLVMISHTVFAAQDTMSENSQDTLINNSQEDILSSKLENTKIDGEDPENPLESVNKVS